MIPVLITPPAEAVTLSDMKAHLRVDHDEDDVLISGLIDGATAHMDGWRGVLGRAIMPQTWAQEWTCSGPYRLVLPDVDVGSIVATVDGVAAADFTTELTPLGLVIDGLSGDLVRVEYACALPAELLPVAQTAIKLLVGHWYATREAAGQQLAPAPLAFDAIIQPLRWVRV